MKKTFIFLVSLIPGASLAASLVSLGATNVRVSAISADELERALETLRNLKIDGYLPEAILTFPPANAAADITLPEMPASEGSESDSLIQALRDILGGDVRVEKLPYGAVQYGTQDDFTKP